MKELPKPNSWADYVGSIVLFAFFLIGIIIFWKTVVYPNKEQDVRSAVETVIQEKEIVLRAPKCDQSLDEYQKLVQAGQSVQLAQNYNTYATNGQFINARDVIVTRLGDGEIACGYLYIKAHTSKGSLDEKYDSIFINPQGFGGHLLRPRGLSINIQEKGFTQVLFSLQSVAYLPAIPYDPQSQEFKISDWSKLLNVGQDVKFTLGLSIENTGATFDEIRIAYRCWDPLTGKETDSCQLSKK